MKGEQQETEEQPAGGSENLEQAITLELGGGKDEQPNPSDTGKKAPGEGEDRTHKPDANEDPDLDLGLDDKGQARKVKLSQVKEWEKGFMLQSDYTKKTQELAAEREQVKEMFGILEHLKKNPEKARKIVAILDEKAEDIKEKKEDLKEQEDEIDKILNDLPEDDPYAVVLRKQKATIAAMQAESKNVLTDLQKRLDSYENNLVKRTESEWQEQAKAVLTDALNKTSAALEFVDDDEKAEWRRNVLMAILKEKRPVNSEEEFRAYVKEIGDKVGKDMATRGEKYVKRYLTKKEGPKPPSKPAAPAQPEKKPGDQESDTLQDQLEKELQNELKNNPQ